MPYTPPGYIIDTYPLMCQYEPKEEWLDNVSRERSIAGDLWGRALYVTKKKALLITHKGLSVTEKQQLEAFYDTHRDKVFDLRFAALEAPGTSSSVHRVMYSGPPTPVFVPETRTYDVFSKFEEQ